MKTDTGADQIILLAKQYIYACILYQRYQVQKEIVINKELIGRFTEQWEPYTNIFRFLLRQSMETKHPGD